MLEILRSTPALEAKKNKERGTKLGREEDRRPRLAGFCKGGAGKKG